MTDAYSNDCMGINGEGGGLIEFPSLVGQNRNIPEPSTGLLLSAVGLIGVGVRMKHTFRASSESAGSVWARRVATAVPFATTDASGNDEYAHEI